MCLMKTSTAPHSRIEDHRPSSAERHILRLKLALEYGDSTNGRYPLELKVRQTRVVNGERVRSYRIDSHNVGIDLVCHMCESNLQCSDPSDKFTYCEMDRIEAGGRYVFDNLLPACRRCNAQRGNADLPASHVAAYRARYGKGGKYRDLRS